MLVDQKKLDFYVEKNLNVLFEGERGVGKTSIIHKTFEKVGLRVKYFSAPTMDPWTDLVGVPSTVTRTDGKEVLRLIQPEDFVDDKYDVIFIDELNRAPKKVMNALMELIQFKTINGKPYNIKMIWAAINPHKEDEEYHVEPLDPAVKDRFQIQIKFPYKVDMDFFRKSHGQVGVVFCEWWNNQPEQIQKEISPRRLFDAAGFYLDGGDFEDMLTVGNTEKLREDLKNVSQLLILEKDFKEKNIGSSKAILAKNYSANVSKFLKSSYEIFEFFLPHIDSEWVAKEFTTKNKIYDYIVKLGSSTSPNKNVAEAIIKDIVAINPGKNPFVRNNLKDLEKYLLPENKTLYSEAAAKPILDLSSQHSLESLLINTLGDKKLMEQKSSISGVDLKILDSTLIFQVTELGLKAINKNAIDLDRCKLQISERIGAVLARVIAQDKTNASIQNSITSLTDKSNKHYVWTKSRINPQFHDMGDKILDVMKRYVGMQPNEIQSEYAELTTKRRKNQATKKPRGMSGPYGRQVPKHKEGSFEDSLPNNPAEFDWESFLLDKMSGSSKHDDYNAIDDQQIYKKQITKKKHF